MRNRYILRIDLRVHRRTPFTSNIARVGWRRLFSLTVFLSKSSRIREYFSQA
jgi:hypothetical protein